MGHTKLGGGGTFKRAYRLAKDELLRLKYMIEGLEQLLVDGAYWRLRSNIGTGIGTGAGAGFCSGRGWSEADGAAEVGAVSCTQVW